MSIDATFWVAVSFVIFIIGLVYLKVPNKINNAITVKINEAKNELEEAEKLKDEAKNLLSNYENKLNQATKETKNILEVAKAESEKNIINSTEKFYQIIDIKKKNFNEKIEQMKDDAIKEIKNIAASVSIEASEKIIKNSIDKKKLDKFYNENLNQTKIIIKKSIS
tara:strand:- start:69 stop:566 length:498 start_codon:yes stop_codon:yes gene_type:complete